MTKIQAHGEYHGFVTKVIPVPPATSATSGMPQEVTYDAFGTKAGAGRIDVTAYTPVGRVTNTAKIEFAKVKSRAVLVAIPGEPTQLYVRESIIFGDCPGTPPPPAAPGAETFTPPPESIA